MRDPDPRLPMQELTNPATASQITKNEVVRVVNPSVVGDLRLHTFHSRILRNSRTLRVWLPPGYDDAGNSKRYPVFYLQDGQNLFDTETAFGHTEWQVDETTDRLIRENVIPPMIVVGIDNMGMERLKEYSPYRSFNPPIFRPLGKRYREFLVLEVMSFIEREYRIAKGPENTGIGGSSLGGLISLYTVMAAPGVFGKLLVESPSLFLAKRQAIKEARKVLDWPFRVYLGIGTAETGDVAKNVQFVNDLNALSDIMRRGGLHEQRLRVHIEEGANHSEGSWARRFPGALQFLFGKIE
jgi:predicted alpha/beta superfamily hydrolase